MLIEHKGIGEDVANQDVTIEVDEREFFKLPNSIQEKFRVYAATIPRAKGRGIVFTMAGYRWMEIEEACRREGVL